MDEQKGLPPVGKARGRGPIVTLLTILLMAMAIPNGSAEGSALCPIPQKGSQQMKQLEPKAAGKAMIPPIDRISPVKTETATFALG